MSMSVIASESEVETLRAEKESLNHKKDEIVSQCSVSAKSGSKCMRHENEKVPEQLQALALTVGKWLKHQAKLETVELQ